MKGKMMSDHSHDIQALAENVARLEGQFIEFGKSIRSDIDDIKGTLAKLVPMIVRIDEKLSGVASASDVAELRGRIEEQSKFLQIALASRQSRRSSA